MLYYNLDGQGTALKILYMLLCVFVCLFVYTRLQIQTYQTINTRKMTKFWLMHLFIPLQ